MTERELLEMRQKRVSLIKKSREAYEALEESKAAEDRNKYENIEKDLAELEERIAEHEKHLAREADIKQVITEDLHQPEQKVSESYKEAFEAYVREGISIPSNLITEAAVITNGSYLVPVDYANRIKELKYASSVVRKLADVITVSHDYTIPLEGTLGAAEWIDKDGAYPENAMGFSRHAFTPYKVGRMLPIAEEILADTELDLEEYIARKFATSIGVAEETAFVSGDGDGCPTGILETATQGVETASTSAITYNEILDLFYSVGGQYAANGTWVMKRSTLKTLRQLKDGDYYIFQPGSKADTIEGRPIVTSENMSAIGAGNQVIAFGDFKQYQIVDRAGFTMQRLVEKYADYGQVGFRGYSRTDGYLLIAAAIKTLDMASS